MTTLPPHLDELMWKLAESDDAHMIDQFKKEHPTLAKEITKRLSMVRKLKGSRPKNAAPKRQFMPSRRVTPQGPSPILIAVVALTLLASTVFATVGIVKYNQASQASQQTAENPTQSTPTINTQQEPNLFPDTQTQENNQPPPANNNPPFQAPISPFDRPVTVVASRVGLSTALADIAVQAGIRLELAPGMPELEITLDYRDVPAKAVLEDLGQNFGFTPFIQGANTALLVPAVDPTRRDDQPQIPGNSDVAQERRDGNSPILELPN